uniref:Solute carrier organic anion transporter family member n=2 Tax=Arion vulgaris TaxID=1028688 RepID=A0A0B7BDA8_9EUPU
MKHATYELSSTKIAQDQNDGVINNGFQEDTVTGTIDGKIKTFTPFDKETCASVDKEKAQLETNEDIDDIYCGFGSCRPPVLQGCKNMVCFSAMYSVIGLVTSALITYINSQITTLEKHFNMSSSMSGFIMSCNDIGYLATTLFVSYYARRVHIPRSLSLCTILYGISAVLCTMAYFSTKDQLPSLTDDSYQGRNQSLQKLPRVDFAQICQNLTSTSSSCEQNSKGQKSVLELSDKWKTIAICFIALGMILQGTAKSPRQAYIGTYVDDNLPRTKTSLYLGIMTGVSIFGPSIAYALGGVVSNVYITLEETNISPRDPRWLGAWWLGFLIFGGAGILVAIPLIFFPRRMYVQKTLDAIKLKEKVDKKGMSRLCHDFKGLLKSILHLTVNPVFLCLMFASGLNLMSVGGLMAFLPKYIETQFSVTAARANILLGATYIVAGPAGTIVGGYITSRLKLSPQACLKFMIALKSVTIAISTLTFIFGCDQPITLMGRQTNSSSTLSVSKCVQDCHCNDNKYFPVCGQDGNTYFSPCHAGCLAITNNKFTNCSCLASRNSKTATGGLCEQDCNMLYPYLILNLMSAFLSTMAIMPAFIAVVRSVREEDKPLAIGLNAFVGTLLGWLPGPVVFGILVDSVCMLWRTTCSTTGACSLYNIELFRVRFNALSIGLSIATYLFYIIALLYAVCSTKTVFQPHNDEISVIVTEKYNAQEIDGSEKELPIKVNNKAEQQDKQNKD